MAKKTGIFSYSSGSGKTTTCAYLATALSTVGKKVVCVDMNGDLGNFMRYEAGNNALPGWTYRRWNGAEDALEDEADYVLVDLPTYLNQEEEGIFTRLHSVLIPVEAEYYGAEHLSRTLQKITEFDQLLISGIFLTKANSNRCVPHRMEMELKEYFSFFMLNTKIMRNYYLSRSRFSLTDLNEQGWHSGFIDYLKLANELLEHEC